MTFIDPQIDQPTFVDNREGNTLERAIREHLAALRRSAGPHPDLYPRELCVATTFFNVPGFQLVADELEKVGKMRLLLGAEPEPESSWPERDVGDPPEDAWRRERVEEGLEGMQQGLRRQRDLLPFDQVSDAAVRRLLRFLRSGAIAVRRFERSFLHAKAFDFRMPGGGLLVGSANLTRAGLRDSLELVLGHHDDALVGRVERWYDELWNEAVEFDLAAVYERLVEVFPPYLIYLRILLELYGSDLEEEAGHAAELPILTFQRHGVWRALKILEEFGGVLIADGVGLGKTFTAGEIMQRYRKQRQRVLLVCPAALRDSTWKEFLYRHQLDPEVVSYEQLALDVQFGGRSRNLMSPLADYALVVVDEAHNYRNPAAPTRAGILRHLLAGEPRDLVLLTATPVNNSLWDLYHMLRYFVRQDGALAAKGVTSIRERFEEAMAEDPFALNPDLLYPVIDATTVKRTRRFVRRHYKDDLLPDEHGVPVPIRFPRPVPKSLKYDLDKTLPGVFAEIERALAPAQGPPALRLARYKADRYPAGSTPDREDSSLVGLIRSGLLKRFESSVHGFRRSLERMIAEHETFLETLDRGYVATKEVLREISAADDESEIDELLGSSESKPVAAYNLNDLRVDVEADRDLLRDLRRQTDGLDRKRDPKLEVLVEALVDIAEQARRESLDEEDERDKRKVLIFSYFEDTVDWIEEHLSDVVESDPRLKCYRGRVASVAGNDVRGGVNREQAVFGFAPRSSDAPEGFRDDRFDILVSTDVLAEGMNLQQCRHIVNFDLPWNPMRLVQRHGRIDRIKSPHQKVYLRTFFPGDALEALLRLEGRVRWKLAQAAASVGVETPPIELAAHADRSFAETREEIERLEREDSTLYEDGGTSSAAQTGEEYRQELRIGLARFSVDLEELPWKAGSGLVRGDRRGHLFCARIGSRDDLRRVYLRFIPLDESDSKIDGELGSCLRLVECSETTKRVMPPELAETAYDAWRRARKNIHEAWMRETDPANLQPPLRKLNLEIADHLRAYPPRGVDAKKVTFWIEAVEAPMTRREENQLRAVFVREDMDDAEKSQQLGPAIDDLGLQPFQPPQPLPPISLDEIHLICWMAIESEGSVQKAIGKGGEADA